ncbi:MAG TPA: DsbA family protein [Solirubrobacteraceae bacterium]
MAKIEITHFTDPGCPWAYSASPAIAVLKWRYGAQLDWRLVTIGLTESAEQYIERGYTPVRATRGYMRYRRRYGMPFATEPRERIIGTALACRAIVATRLLDPAREDEAFRALQIAWFTTTLLLDEPRDIARALARVPGLDAQAVIDTLQDERVSAAYQADRQLARTAASSPAELQGKTAQTDGPVRYTAPSLVLQRDDTRLEAGGFQPVQAYDVLIANLDPSLERLQPPQTPLAALERFPAGLVTQEVAAIMAVGNDEPDRDAVEGTLVELASEGVARRVPLGDDALWLAV